MSTCESCRYIYNNQRLNQHYLSIHILPRITGLNSNPLDLCLKTIQNITHYHFSPHRMFETRTDFAPFDEQLLLSKIPTKIVNNFAIRYSRQEYLYKYCSYLSGSDRCSCGHADIVSEFYREK